LLETWEKSVPGNRDVPPDSKIWSVLADFKFHNIPVITDEAHYAGYSPPIKTTIIKKTSLIETDVVRGQG